ncbi:hypothetical protein EOD41_11040 [Mucilaginibacter limnophilus]|uniref:Transporter n=1 Tax=Mucilaginibacter limnophilus TaxID=1932778 RepID=A0A437MS85_9SPHI|nr:hypothetical protein [Mucilaginibacter limnophilus]RVU00531.1 hypothetical protein EOD41_11040 [Mucilaginibacter limnophilus]
MKKNILTKLLLSVLLLASALTNALAGGMPVKKGKYILSGSISYFRSNDLWGGSGKVVKYPSNGYFSSTSVSLYGEYGISRRFTAVVTLPYLVNDFILEDGINSVSGLGDAEVGLRYYLGNIGFKHYFGLQASAVLPLYSNATLGFSKPAVDAKISYSGSGKLGSKSISLGGDIGVRQYFESEGPFQFKYSGNFSYYIGKKDQIGVGVSGAISTSINKTVNPNILINKDYSFTMASLNYGHNFTPKLSLFAGANHILVGRSTGRGNSFLLSVITKF